MLKINAVLILTVRKKTLRILITTTIMTSLHVNDFLEIKYRVNNLFLIFPRYFFLSHLSQRDSLLITFEE